MVALEELSKNCHKCKNKLQVVERLTLIEFYCTTCAIHVNYKLNEEVGRPCCINKSIRYTKRQNNGAGHRFLVQCQSCGYTDNHAVSRKKIPLSEDIWPFNETLHETFVKNIDDFLQKQLTNFNGLAKTEYVTWLKENYYPYLESDTWKKKVRAVLKRDSDLCQACLINNATTAHQVTFRHIFNEPLFDLVAICKACKEKLMNMEIENTIRPKGLIKVSNPNEVI